MGSKVVAGPKDSRASARALRRLQPGHAAGQTDWLVYLIRAPGGEIYTGITTNVDRRLGQHEAGKGAKYLRGRGPLVVVYRRRLGGRGIALRVESRVKRLTKSGKEAIVRTAPSRDRLLSTLRVSERT